MICSEAREYLFAFLDNELDAHLSIEVQRHLDHCPDCAQQAEIEREIHKQLAAKLEDGALAPPLDESALQAMLTSGRPATASSRSSPSRRYVLRSAGAAAAVLAVFMIWRGMRQADVADRPSAGLAQLVVQDYEHFLQEGQQVQLASADAGEVSSWLREKTDLEVSFAATKGPLCKLVGARKCEIAGQPAAFALYEMEGTPVSLVATDEATIGVGLMKRVENGAHEYWIDRCKGHTVVATRAGDLVYAAVSTLPQNDLIHLIESVVYESD